MTKGISKHTRSTCERQGGQESFESCVFLLLSLDVRQRSLCIYQDEGGVLRQTCWLASQSWLPHATKLSIRGTSC